MTDRTRRTFRDVVATVQLQDIRLKESSAKTRVRDVKVIAKPNLSVTHGTKVMHRATDGFIVGARLTVRLDDGEPAPASEPYTEIDVTLALSYSLPNAVDFTDDVLEEFAKVNGVFNAWPYLREYVQATSTRMSLPPLVLPVFRVQPAKQNEPNPVGAHTTTRQAGTRRATSGDPKTRQAAKKK
jgi:hypothetical protein